MVRLKLILSFNDLESFHPIVRVSWHSHTHHCMDSVSHLILGPSQETATMSMAMAQTAIPGQLLQRPQRIHYANAQH
jgi:hypothetical protein